MVFSAGLLNPCFQLVKPVMGFTVFYLFASYLFLVQPDFMAANLVFVSHRF